MPETVEAETRSCSWPCCFGPGQFLVCQALGGMMPFQAGGWRSRDAD